MNNKRHIYQDKKINTTIYVYILIDKNRVEIPISFNTSKCLYNTIHTLKKFDVPYSFDRKITNK